MYEIPQAAYDAFSGAFQAFLASLPPGTTQTSNIQAPTHNIYPIQTKLVSNHLHDSNYSSINASNNSLKFSGLPSEDPHSFLVSLEHNCKDAGLDKKEIFNILHTVLDNDPLFWFLHERNSQNLKNYDDFVSAFVTKYGKPSKVQNYSSLDEATSFDSRENNSSKTVHLGENINSNLTLVNSSGDSDSQNNLENSIFDNLSPTISNVIGTPKKLFQDEILVSNEHNSEKFSGGDEAFCGSTTPNFCIVSEKDFLDSKNSAQSFVNNLDTNSYANKFLVGENPPEKFCFANNFDPTSANFEILGEIVSQEKSSVDSKPQNFDNLLFGNLENLGVAVTQDKFLPLYDKSVEVQSRILSSDISNTNSLDLNNFVLDSSTQDSIREFLDVKTEFEFSLPKVSINVSTDEIILKNIDPFVVETSQDVNKDFETPLDEKSQDNFNPLLPVKYKKFFVRNLLCKNSVVESPNGEPSAKNNLFALQSSLLSNNLFLNHSINLFEDILSVNFEYLGEEISQDNRISLLSTKFFEKNFYSAKNFGLICNISFGMLVMEN